MRDTLPSDGSRRNESAIVNLDSDAGPGTHWVAYKKRGNSVIYFDSFGDLRPPPELETYLRKNYPSVNIYYNTYVKQKFNSFRCGHLCLEFLQK